MLEVLDKFHSAISNWMVKLEWYILETKALEGLGTKYDNRSWLKNKAPP
jgi:hypothetical protein